MTDWFVVMDDLLWLHADEVGEKEARFLLRRCISKPAMRCSTLRPWRGAYRFTWPEPVASSPDWICGLGSLPTHGGGITSKGCLSLTREIGRESRTAL